MLEIIKKSRNNNRCLWLFPTLKEVTTIAKRQTKRDAKREREKKNRNYGFFIRTRNRNYRMIHSVNHSFELAKGNNIPESNHVTFARRRCVIFRIHFSRISDIMLAHAEGNVQQAKTNKSGFVRLRALQSLTDTRVCMYVCVYACFTKQEILGIRSWSTRFVLTCI